MEERNIEKNLVDETWKKERRRQDGAEDGGEKCEIFSSAIAGSLD